MKSKQNLVTKEERSHPRRILVEIVCKTGEYQFLKDSGGI
jgi:hypothetical protein